VHNQPIHCSASPTKKTSGDFPIIKYRFSWAAHLFGEAAHLIGKSYTEPIGETMKVLPTTLSLFCVLLLSNAEAQTSAKNTLNRDGAKKVIAGAVAEAKRLNAPGAAIAVVDDGGNLIAVERLDHTFAAGAHISIGKARTAALFQRPTKTFEDIINEGRTAMTSLNDFTPLQGGVPILVDGQIVGAIGVSGASSAQQDEELAIAGAAAIK
jgi:glc operon protein GlcG